MGEINPNPGVPLNLKDFNLIGGFWTFEPWGIGSGMVNTISPPPINSKVYVSLGYDKLFSARVVKQKYNHKQGYYESELKDAMTAIFPEGVEYEYEMESDYILSDLAGSVYEEFIDPSQYNPFIYIPKAVLFPTRDDPVNFQDLLKSISMAEGYYIGLNPEGGWTRMGIEDPWGPQEPMTIIPIEAKTYFDMSKYANVAVFLIDEDWVEDALYLKTTTETGYGITRTIKKYGEQLSSINTNYGEGLTSVETWTWDVDGNLTKYTNDETGVLEKFDSVTEWDLNPVTGQFVMEESKIVWKRPNPVASWFNYRKYEKTTKTYLDDTAPIVIDEYTFWYFQEEGVWHNKEWVRRKGLAQTPGIIESSRNDYYEYSEADGNWYLQKTLNEGGLRRPEWTKMLRKNKVGKHFSGSGIDEASQGLVGEIEQSYRGWGLGSIEVVKLAGLNLLHYHQRANTAIVDVPSYPYTIGLEVKMGNEVWIIERVTHRLENFVSTLELSKKAEIVEVEANAIGDPDEIGEAFVKILQQKSQRLNNAAKASIVAQIDYETYEVHLHGEPEDKIRTARVDYRRGESFQPGKEVLLVRPTGKRTGWEIVTRRNDPPVVFGTLYTPPPPAPLLGFYTPAKVYNPYGDYLIIGINSGHRFEVVWGNEGETVRKFKKGPFGWVPDGQGYGFDGQDKDGRIFMWITSPVDPALSLTQECTGKIRLMGNNGAWTPWHPFTYTFESPRMALLEWTEELPYEGTTLYDIPSALVKDVTITMACDVRTVIGRNASLEFFYNSIGGIFNSTPSTHHNFFRLYGTEKIIEITGVYTWQYSMDNETWHTPQTIYDRYIRVSNGNEFTDSRRADDRDGFFMLKSGGHYNEGFDWYNENLNATRDENGNLVITKTYRLGYSGLDEGGTAIEHIGPPYALETAEISPRITIGALSNYTWESPV